MIEAIGSKDSLADFIAALRLDLETNPDEWENRTLDGFLDAMEAWVRAMDGFYKNTGQKMPETPDWRMFAHILYAAKIYE
jgi:hypothetical protein